MDALSRDYVTKLGLRADDPESRARLVDDLKQTAIHRFPFTDEEFRRYGLFELLVLDGGGYFATRKLCGGADDASVARAVSRKSFWTAMGGLAHIDWRTFLAQRRIEEQVWLDRWYWVMSLARQWWVTGYSRHAHLLRRLYQSWVNQSPPPREREVSRRPPCWRDMQLAWRTMAGLFTLRLLANCAELDADFWIGFLDTWLAGVGMEFEEDRHRRHLPGNHQSHAQMTLSYAAAIWPQFADSSRWWEHAQARLAEHLDRFDTDFYSHEISPSYAAFVIQIYRDVTVLGRRLGLSLDPRIPAVVEPACQALMAAMQPNRHLVPLCDAYEMDLTPFLEITVRLMGFDRARWNFDAGATDLPRCIVFPKTGIASLRSDWSRKASYALMDFSPCLGGHWHGGKLGVTLCVGEQPILVDPGCGDYCEAEFEWLRQPHVHTSLLVDGTGDSATRMGRPWSWAFTPRCRVLQRINRENFECIVAESRWPTRSVRHVRALALMDNRCFVLADRVECSGEHEFSFLFHFAPDLQIDFDTNGQALWAKGRTVSVRLQPLDVGSFQWAICPGKAYRNGTYHRSLIAHRWAIARDTVQACLAVISSESEEDSERLTKAAEFLREQVCVNGGGAAT